jgi:hypothetical protein
MPGTERRPRRELSVPDRLAAVVGVCWARSGPAGGSGDEDGDDVGGVAVQGLAATVVAHRRARVGVAGGFLHVA